MKILLTFENGNTEILNISKEYSMKMAKLEYLNSWRPDGIVVNVSRLKQGGSRKGSGAKLKYNEPTKTIAVRVPISKIDEIKQIIKEYLNQLKK